MREHERTEHVQTELARARDEQSSTEYRSCLARAAQAT